VNVDTALAASYSIEPIHERMLQVALLGDGSAEKRWSELREEIDLDTFWDGRALNFLPLVYRALVDEGSDHRDLPRLRGVHRKTWYDNQLRFRSIAPALHALSAAEVDALVLKGTAFALAFYPDMGLRPMLDCDLLVRPGQVGRALEVLEPSGWSARESLPQNYASHAQELDVWSTEGAVIDLHWHIAQWLVPPDDPWNADDQYWSRSVAIDVSGAPARALDPTDAVLHSIVHGSRHGWRDAPQWIADTVVITRAKPVDWDRLVDIALARGIALPVGYALRYLADTFAVAVPEAARQRLDVPTRPRSRRMFALTGRGHDATRAEHRVLGTGAATYRFWVTESAPYDRRLAAATFPGWLADHWGVPKASQLPVAALKRVARRVGGTGDGADDVSTRRAP
jgi:hypothetical protein